MADMTIMEYLNDMGSALGELPKTAQNTLLANTLAKFNDHEQECGECDHQNGKPCTWADGMYTGFTLASNMERLNEIAETDVDELVEAHSETLHGGTLEHVEVTYEGVDPGDGWDAFCNNCHGMPVTLVASREEALQGLRAHQLGGCTDG